MAKARTAAELVKRPGRSFESRALRFEQLMPRLIGGAEVRVNGVKGEILTGEQRRQRAFQVVVSEPKPIHAGVDLQVVMQRRAALLRRLLQRVARRGAQDRRRQI